MKIEHYKCDIKGCGNVVPEPNRQTQIQVIFNTEQTEGRIVKHYLEIKKLDICPSCLNHVLDGNYIYASGAQGYNDYYFSAKLK